jgi:hypothetical protein
MLKYIVQERFQFIKKDHGDPDLDASRWPCKDIITKHDEVFRHVPRRSVFGWLSRACGTSAADASNMFRHVSAATEGRCSEITPAVTIQTSATLITAPPTWNNTVRAHEAQVNTSEDAVSTKWQHRTQKPRVSGPSTEEENKRADFKLPRRF